MTTPSPDDATEKKSDATQAPDVAKTKRLELIEKMFLALFTLLGGTFSAFLFSINAKVDTLIAKENADIASVIEKVSASSEKINGTIKAIEVSQASFKATIEARDAIAAQKQRR